MKKIILLGFFTVAGLVAFAQDSNTMYLKQDTSAKKNSTKDYLAMKGGTMMVYKNGDSVAMTSVMTLQDGTIVKQDGTLTRKNGQVLKLKEGQRIYMTGMLWMKNDMLMMNKKDSTSK